MKLDLEPRIEAGPSFMFSLKAIFRTTAQILNPLVDTVATLSSYFVNGVLPVIHGGTGAATAAAARTNLGAVNIAGDTMTGDLSIQRAANTSLNVISTSGYSALLMSKSASGQGCYINGRTGSADRWQIILGDAASESGSNAGSDFKVVRFSDAGSAIAEALSITRSSGAVAVPGTFTATGSIYSSGVAHIVGYIARQGTSGGEGGNAHNWFWTGSAINAYVDSTNVGTLAFTSDERVKHSLFDLAADRAAYLLIRPKRFHYRNIGIFTDDGERWGFSAQNLLTCLPKAVIGAPDAMLEDGTPQPMNVQDRPILAQTVLMVQQLITATESQAQLIAQLRAELDILKGA